MSGAFTFVDELRPAGDELIRVLARVQVLATADGGRSRPFTAEYRPNHNFGGDTPRAGSQRGRYQSPPLSFDEVQHLLRKHRDLFEQDGRSDIWIRAEAPELTVVVDQHDLIYAYGPAQTFVSRLAGFRNARTAIPSPHAHNYHAQFDELEQMLTSELEWNVSELWPEDDP